MKALCLAVLCGLLPLAAMSEDAGASAELLTRGGTDILGRPLAYPTGAPDVTVAVVTLPPGAETGWHSHEVPLVGHMIDGVLTVDYGTRGTRVYRQGDALIEAVGWPHNGRNEGTEPVRILAVYIGAKGMDNATPEPGPR